MIRWGHVTTPGLFVKSSGGVGDSVLDAINEVRPHASTLVLFQLPGNRVYSVADALPLISFQAWVRPRQPGRGRAVRCEPWVLGSH